MFCHIAVSGLTATAIIATPVRATDYSKLFEPSFARLHLVSSQRVLQAECAGLAVHLSQTGSASDKAAASRLAEAVSRRLGTELGDAETGRAYVEGKAQNYVSPYYEPKTVKGIVEIMEPKCRSLMALAGKGDHELDEALGPIPTAPLELPGTEQCLAVVTYGVERKAELMDGAGEFVTVLRNDMLENVEPKEAERRAAIFSKGVDVLEQHSPDNEQLNGMIYACFPTIHEAAKRLSEKEGKR